jgi:hypothetical protein
LFSDKKQLHEQKASQNDNHHMLFLFCTKTSQQLVPSESFLIILHPYDVILTADEKALTNKTILANYLKLPINQLPLLS